jgi:hypothetical protein
LDIAYFDFYIMIRPWAKKLEQYGVFGLSSGEYLNYALRNRMEWEHNGREFAKEMITKWKIVGDCTF